MMEVIFTLAALALGLYLLLCPIIALITARNAHSRITELEQSARELREKLTGLTRELAKATVRTPYSTESGQPSENASTPASSLHQTGQATGPALASQAETITKADVATEFGMQVSSTSLTGEQSQTIATGGETDADTSPRKSTRLDQWLEESSDGEANGRSETPAPAWVIKIKTLLFGGNLVAKVGLLILFLGVSFLLKYAAARITVPIEYRLVGIVLADIALLLWAWRIREGRPAISLPVQGAAVAILMLVTFGAYKIYGLFPGSVAFALLFVLTAFTCLLAVLQDAVWLAVFGIAGGFAAPILTTTGGGNHIGLFSYYMILNAGILAIALYRSWRLLNLVGFAFTFIIGTVWGVFRYTPEHYLSLQLFLILFFIFYVLITILYASRQAPNLKQYVDGTLVFGTPLVTFALQYGLVKDVAFGLAYSSLGLGLFYITIALVLWQRRGTSLKLLTESFLALGVVFGTLTIPFALDGRWTSAAWALEGAGMVWVGLRQRQTLAWVFGLLVQFGAWMSFIGSVTGIDPIIAMQSNLWLGFLLLSATAFLMALNFRQQTDDSHPVDFAPFATVFLAVAGAWMLAGAWTEIALRTEGTLQANLLAMSGLLVAIVLSVIAWQMQWQIARSFALFAQIIAGLVFLGLAVSRFDATVEPGQSLFAGPFLGALLIGLGAFFSSGFFHRQDDLAFSKLSNRLLFWSGFWWFGFVLYAWAEWLQGQYRLFLQIEPYRTNNLFWCAYDLSLVVFATGFVYLAEHLRWRQLRWFGASVWVALGLTTLLMLGDLHFNDGMPYRETWFTFLALWGMSEWLLFCWRNKDWNITIFWLKALHTLRIAGPWLMIWPVGRRLISDWLGSGTSEEQALLAQAGWFTSGSWPRYLPAWVMMLAIVWVIRQTRSGGWPVYPIADWYRRVLIPLGAAWSIFLVAVWNLTQNGRMAPLPYLPILNPLDLTTGFSILLGMETFRLIGEEFKEDGVEQSAWLTKAPWIASFAVYAWFNLMLLRSVAVYLDIPYQFEPLFDSQFVQTLLSLVWSVTALILMRMAAQRVLRKVWMLGAILLGIVVAKLFLVDLSNIGGLARVVSFVGVGLLMLAIGYLAPFPTELGKQSDNDKSTPPKP